MQYDKESFLAGVAVGRQLKGWAAYGLTEGSKPPRYRENIEVQSGAETFIEETPEGYDAILTVTVKGDPALIPDNIRLNRTIFGVEGAYYPVYKSQDTTKTVVKNGSYVYYPDYHYDGIGRLTLDVDVPTAVNNQGVLNVQTITTAAQSFEPEAGYTGFSKVIVPGSKMLVAENIKKDVEIFGVKGTFGGFYVNETRSVTPSSINQKILPTSDNHRLSLVTVFGDANLIPENIRSGYSIFGIQGAFSGETQYIDLDWQEKIVTPGSTIKEVRPDSGKALRKVTVRTDSNLKPNNILKGVRIFDVEGSYEPKLASIRVIPSRSMQFIAPDNDMDGFNSIVVEPMPFDDVEWEGTQQEYDALLEYDPNVSYYILRET